MEMKLESLDIQITSGEQLIGVLDAFEVDLKATAMADDPSSPGMEMEPEKWLDRFVVWVTEKLHGYEVSFSQAFSIACTARRMSNDYKKKLTDESL